MIFLRCLLLLRLPGLAITSGKCCAAGTTEGDAGAAGIGERGVEGQEESASPRPKCAKRSSMPVGPEPKPGPALPLRRKDPGRFGERFVLFSPSPVGSSPPPPSLPILGVFCAVPVGEFACWSAVTGGV